MSRRFPSSTSRCAAWPRHSARMARRTSNSASMRRGERRSLRSTRGSAARHRFACVLASTRWKWFSGDPSRRADQAAERSPHDDLAAFHRNRRPCRRGAAMKVAVRVPPVSSGAISFAVCVRMATPCVRSFGPLDGARVRRGACARPVLRRAARRSACRRRRRGSRRRVSARLVCGPGRGAEAPRGECPRDARRRRILRSHLGQESGRLLEQRVSPRDGRGHRGGPHVPVGARAFRRDVRWRFECAGFAGVAQRFGYLASMRAGV